MIQAATGTLATSAMGTQPGRVWEGRMAWSQLLLGSKAGGLRQVMSYLGRVPPSAHRQGEPVATLLCVDGTVLATEPIPGTQLLQLQSRVKRPAHCRLFRGVCQNLGSGQCVVRRGALWAPDGGSLRSRCWEPPLWSVPQPPGAPSTMLGNGERKVRSLPVLSPASTWAVGFRPRSHPGPCASDACEEFSLPNAKIGAQGRKEGRCPSSHDRHRLLVSGIQGSCRGSVGTIAAQPPRAVARDTQHWAPLPYILTPGAQGPGNDLNKCPRWWLVCKG